jgi:hypothetical protein
MDDRIAKKSKTGKHELQATHKKIIRQRPTHFLSLRLNSSHLWSAASGVQSEILKRHPELADCVVAPSDLHFTLFVASLSSARPNTRGHEHAEIDSSASVKLNMLTPNVVSQTPLEAARHALLDCEIVLRELYSEHSPTIRLKV